MPVIEYKNLLPGPVQAKSSRRWELPPKYCDDSRARMILYMRFSDLRSRELEREYGEEGRKAALGLAELLLNVAIHGRGPVSVIELVVESDGRRGTYWCIQGEGAGFDPAARKEHLAEGTFYGVDHGERRGGWGLTVTRECADYLAFTGDGKGAFYARLAA